MTNINNGHQNNQEKAGPAHGGTKKQTDDELIILSVAVEVGNTWRCCYLIIS